MHSFGPHSLQELSERYHQLEESQNEWHKKYERKCESYPHREYSRTPDTLCSGGREKQAGRDGRQAASER